MYNTVLGKKNTPKPDANPGLYNRNKYTLVYIYGFLNANIINYKASRL